MSRYVYLITETLKYGNELEQSTYLFTNKKNALQKFDMQKVGEYVRSLFESIASGKIYAQKGKENNFYCNWLEKDFSQEYFCITFQKIKLEKGKNVVEYTETFDFKKGEGENDIRNIKQ